MTLLPRHQTKYPTGPLCRGQAIEGVQDAGKRSGAPIVTERTGESFYAAEAGAPSGTDKRLNGDRSFMFNLTSNVASQFEHRARDVKQGMLSIWLHRHQHPAWTQDAGNLTQIRIEALIGNVVEKQRGNHSVKTLRGERHIENIAYAGILHRALPGSLWGDVQANKLSVRPNTAKRHSIFTVTAWGNKYVVSDGNKFCYAVREIPAGDLKSEMISQGRIKRPAIEPMLCKALSVVPSNLALESSFSIVHAAEHSTRLEAM